MSATHKRLYAPLIMALLATLAASCSIDPEYDIDITQVDTEVTLFEEGLNVPIGSTNKIVLGTLLNSTGQNLDDFLKTDASGRLVLTYSGSTSLTDMIAGLDLNSMASLNGISFNKDFSYHIGDVDPDKFTIAAQQFNVSVPFTGVESVDMSLSPVAANLDNLNFKAGLDKYKNVVNGNDNLKLGETIGNLDWEMEMEKKQALQDWGAMLGSDPIAIPAGLLPNLTIEPTNIPVSVPSFKLHDDVTAVPDIQLKSTAKLNVAVRVTNPYIISGEVVPNINLDLSGLLAISGGSVINVSDLVLNSANGWSNGKSYTITGLATTSYGNTIAINENVALSGNLTINDPVTNGTTLASPNKMKFEVTISFTDLTIESAAIAVSPISFSHSETITIGNDTPFALPQDIKDVKSVQLDPTKPLHFSITPSNLNRLQSKNLPYTIELDFPEQVKVQGATNGKLSFSGDLATGPCNQDIVIEAFYPDVQNGSATVNAQVGINAEFNATNLVMSSADLPSTASEDIAFAVALNGSPAISDITVTINDIEKTTEMSDNLEFEIDGAATFGSFVITPEGTPAFVVTCNIPSIPGVDVVTGTEGILVTLPDVFEFNTSSLPASVTFDQTTNSLLIKGQIPASITLPITHLRINPVTVGNVTKIQTGYAVNGKIVIPSADISTSDVQTLSGQEFGIVVDIPQIKAASIALDEALSFNLDETYDMSFDIDTDGLLKQINEVILNDVYFTLSSSFQGLPDLGEGKYYVDLTVGLPSYITPNSIPIKGYVQDGQLSISPVKIEKLSGIDLSTSNTVSGDITVKGSISATGSEIDLSSLQSDISVDFQAGIGDANGKITISKASGQFAYDIDQSTSVKLDNVPDMLKQDGFSADLDDPQITLDLSTNMGIVMGGSIELVPLVGGEVQTENKITLDNIVLPYSATAGETATKHYVICKSATTAPAGYEVLEADITKLLTNIPDELQVSIKAGVDAQAISVVEPAASYTYDIAYGITAPLSFGEDFHFTTSAEIDLSSIASFTSYGEFGIKGKVVNDSPINLNVEMVLLDKDDAVIPQSKSSTIAIAGASTSDIEFYLSPTDKTRQIAKGRFDISVTAVPGVALKETSSLQLTDLVAVLPEGVSYKPSINSEQ